MLTLLACAAIETTPPDLTPLEDGLGSGIPIAFATVATGRILAGDETCGTAEPACEEEGCTFDVTISLGETCPLPIAPSATGAIVATISPAVAGYSIDFTGVEADGKGLRLGTVVDSTLAWPENGGTEIQVLWVQEDVGYTDNVTATSGKGADAWLVKVEPGDTTGDSYAITGSAYYGARDTSDTAIEQEGRILVVDDARFGGDCALNPVSGGASVQSGSSDGELNDLDLVNLAFHSACDGKVTASGTTSGEMAFSLLGE